MTAKRGGSGNTPVVRLFDDDVVEVWWYGEWTEARVEDHRTVKVEMDAAFMGKALADMFFGVEDDEPVEVDVVVEDDLPLSEVPCYATHACAEDYCDGWVCDNCGWVCEGDDIEGYPV